MARPIACHRIVRADPGPKSPGSHLCPGANGQLGDTERCVIQPLRRATDHKAMRLLRIGHNVARETAVPGRHRRGLLSGEHAEQIVDNVTGVEVRHRRAPACPHRVHADARSAPAQPKGAEDPTRVPSNKRPTGTNAVRPVDEHHGQHGEVVNGLNHIAILLQVLQECLVLGMEDLRSRHAGPW